MKDSKVTSLIANSEMYKSSSRKTSQVNKVKAKQSNIKQQSDKSDNKRRLASNLIRRVTLRAIVRSKSVVTFVVQIHTAMRHAFPRRGK